MPETHAAEPSAQRFEQQLGRFLAMHRCALCSKPLGSEPRRHSKHRMFHPGCHDFMIRTGVVQLDR